MLESAAPNLGVLVEYKQRQEEYESKVAELVQATLARDVVKEVYDNLRKKRLEEFMKGFTAISLKLKEMYQVGRTVSFGSGLAHKISIPADDYPWRQH